MNFYRFDYCDSYMHRQHLGNYSKKKWIIDFQHTYANTAWMDANIDWFFCLNMKCASIIFFLSFDSSYLFIRWKKKFIVRLKIDRFACATFDQLNVMSISIFCLFIHFQMLFRNWWLLKLQTNRALLQLIRASIQYKC